MDYKYIQQLLERYWMCETTLEEEEILRTFFSQKDIPAGLLRYKDLFAYEQADVRNDVLPESTGSCPGADHYHAPAIDAPLQGGSRGSHRAYNRQRHASVDNLRSGQQDRGYGR